MPATPLPSARRASRAHKGFANSQRGQAKCGRTMFALLGCRHLVALATQHAVDLLLLRLAGGQAWFLSASAFASEGVDHRSVRPYIPSSQSRSLANSEAISWVQEVLHRNHQPLARTCCGDHPGCETSGSATDCQVHIERLRLAVLPLAACHEADCH